MIFDAISEAIAETSIKLGISPTTIEIILLLLLIWTIPWKGMALWKAARGNQKGWFVIILAVNTIAILEIFYIFIFSKKTQPTIASKDEKN